jgi:hypothetical protein
MWQTLLDLAPLTTVALGLTAWTTVDIARSCSPIRVRARGGRRG